ncbi:MAG: Ribosomal RNA small subunit methyltransferase G [Pelotomaculum sp. PtaB.Bin104]|nr:MAG: Ribosomal RNA small subunit methyltransferase G [Pelotomaculum sp. PtaB.Bin104]
MNELVDTLKLGIQEIDMELSNIQLKQFQAYYQMVIEKNKKLNLTAIIDEKEFAIKHLIDSILCIKVMSFSAGMTLLDLGTGAGFPGIPLKICLPELKITLVDAQEKKVKFLKEVNTRLGLEYIEVVHARAEELGHRDIYRESFERLTARAVAGLDILAEYCLPLVKLGGFFLAMKGPKLNEEINAAAKAIKLLGGELEQVAQWKLPLTGDIRNIVLIRKIAPTPRQYPRRNGMPKKKPL